MTSPLGAILTSDPPVFPADRAAALLDDHWAITGALTALTSERDVNYHVAGPAGEFVLKLANPAEPAGETDLQTRALIHLEGADLPVPRVVRTRAGACEVILPEGCLRLLTWVQGKPLHQAPRSDAQRRAIGSLAGRLARALAPFRHPAARRDLIWDIRHAARLRPLLPAIADPGMRALANAALNRFERDLAPHLPHLPTQVVHNDLNPHNVLVDAGDPDRVSGVLDFGDMVETPRLLDLGIAASYLVDPARAANSIDVVRQGYEADYPLTGEERRLLPLAVQTRLLTTLTITAERARLYPGNAAYILRNAPVSAAALEALAKDSP